MKKKLLLTLMMLCSVFMLFACGSNDDDKTENATKEENETKESENASTEADTDFKEDDSTAAATGKKEIHWDIPEGFEKIDTGSTTLVYVTADYPTEASNITYTETKNPEGLNFTADSLESMMEMQYKTSYGYDTDVEVTVFEEIENNGIDGLFMELEYVLNNVNIYQIQYMYQYEDTTYNICYTMSNHKDFEDAFRKSGESITFVDAE